MNAGRFDRRITIQTYTSTRDNVGGEVRSWTDFCDMWANINPGDGNKNTNADRVESHAPVKFTIRYRSDITTAMRIKFDNEYYNISDISEIVRRQYLTLYATTITT